MSNFDEKIRTYCNILKYNDCITDLKNVILSPDMSGFPGWGGCVLQMDDDLQHVAGRFNGLKRLADSATDNF